MPTSLSRSTAEAPPRPEPLTGQSCATWLADAMTSWHTLEDGTRVMIRPLLYSDREELAEGFAHLSPGARHLRFFSPPAKLGPRDLEYLTNIDYRDHFAWVAFADEPGFPGIGVARYVRDPERPALAEVAVTVLDDYQHRGLGTLMTRKLAEVAAAHGITTFVNFVLWENEEVIGQLQEEGARVSHEEPGIARVEVDIPHPAAELPERTLRGMLHVFADLVREALTGHPS